jgi:hypothetical protein
MEKLWKGSPADVLKLVTDVQISLQNSYGKIAALVLLRNWPLAVLNGSETQRLDKSRLFFGKQGVLSSQETPNYDVLSRRTLVVQALPSSPTSSACALNTFTDNAHSIVRFLRTASSQLLHISSLNKNGEGVYKGHELLSDSFDADQDLMPHEIEAIRPKLEEALFEELSTMTRAIRNAKQGSDGLPGLPTDCVLLKLLTNEAMGQLERARVEGLSLMLNQKFEDETSHPYLTTDPTQTVLQIPGAQGLRVMFDPRSKTERKMDILSFYLSEDLSDDSLVKSCALNNFSDFTVPGDKVYVKWKVVGSGTKYKRLSSSWGWKYWVAADIHIPQSQIIQRSNVQLGIWLMDIIVGAREKCIRMHSVLGPDTSVIIHNLFGGNLQGSLSHNARVLFGCLHHARMNALSIARATKIMKTLLNQIVFMQNEWSGVDASRDDASIVNAQRNLSFLEEKWFRTELDCLEKLLTSRFTFEFKENALTSNAQPSSSTYLQDLFAVVLAARKIKIKTGAATTGISSVLDGSHSDAPASVLRNCSSVTPATNDAGEVCPKKECDTILCSLVELSRFTRVLRDSDTLSDLELTALIKESADDGRVGNVQLNDLQPLETTPGYTNLCDVSYNEAMEYMSDSGTSTKLAIVLPLAWKDSKPESSMQATAYAVYDILELQRELQPESNGAIASPATALAVETPPLSQCGTTLNANVLEDGTVATATTHLASMTPGNGRDARGVEPQIAAVANNAKNKKIVETLGNRFTHFVCTVDFTSMLQSDYGCCVRVVKQGGVLLDQRKLEGSELSFPHTFEVPLKGVRRIGIICQLTVPSDSRTKPSLKTCLRLKNAFFRPSQMVLQQKKDEMLSVLKQQSKWAYEKDKQVINLVNDVAHEKSVPALHLLRSPSYVFQTLKSLPVRYPAITSIQKRELNARMIFLHKFNVLTNRLLPYIDLSFPKLLYDNVVTSQAMSRLSESKWKQKFGVEQQTHATGGSSNTNGHHRRQSCTTLHLNASESGTVLCQIGGLIVRDSKLDFVDSALSSTSKGYPSHSMRLNRYRARKYTELAAKRSALSKARKKSPQLQNSAESSIEEMQPHLSDTLELTDKVKSSILGQAYSFFSMICPSDLRYSQQMWEVTYIGEGGEDAGGLFRESITDMVTDLMSDNITPCFIKSCNNSGQVGLDRDKFVPRPSATLPQHLSLFYFVGQLIGMCIRMKSVLALHLPSLFWKQLLSVPLCTDDLERVDRIFVNILDHLKHASTVDSFNIEDLDLDMHFECELTDGRTVELKPGGSEVPVTKETLYEYITLMEEARLYEARSAMSALQAGFACICPIEPFRLFEWKEFERLVCGSPRVDLVLLKKNTNLVNYEWSDNVVKWIFQLLEEFSWEQQALFMRFVWGRDRIPNNSAGFSRSNNRYLHIYVNSYSHDVLHAEI